MHALTPAPDGGYPGENTAEGALALLHLNGGTNNTAVGWASLGFDVTCNLNTAVGAGTLVFNTADSNTATGAGALLSNTIAFQNTATGAFALFSNTSGSNNTAVGADALFSNGDGFRNNAFGSSALSSHQTGNFNNAFGALALSSDQSGARNNAFGDEALASNVIGTDNTALGDFALHNNTRGRYNTAVGAGSLSSITLAWNNIAVGYNAGSSLQFDGNIDIGNTGTNEDTNTIRIGDPATVFVRTFIAGIRGVTTGNGDAINVVIDSAGQLGTISSSRRFKKNVRPMDDASKTILALKPVKFQYKNDKTNTPQFGLIAEDVAEVNPDLVVRDKNGEIYSVHYDQVNAMLLNEFLKEHKAFVEQKHKVQKLEATVASLLITVKEQAAQIQNVSTRVNASRPASRVAVVDP